MIKLDIIYTVYTFFLHHYTFNSCTDIDYYICVFIEINHVIGMRQSVNNCEREKIT